jgi:predicted PurR-regulated permease PerM
MKPTDSNPPNFNFEKIVDLIVKLGVLFLLVMWSYDILKPFILILVWAVIIAVAVYPIHGVIVKLFRGKRILSVILITLLLLSIIIIPSGMVLYSLYEGINHIRELYNTGQPLLPPPGGNTDNWPVFTKPIVEFWQLASQNLHEALIKYSDDIKEYGAILIKNLAGIGKGILFFNISIIIAGVILFYADSSIKVFNKIFKKLAGDRGQEFASVSVITIRNVIKGILGVAIIQTVMAGTGFFIAAVPFPGLWTIICLVLSIVQIGIGPVVIPIAIYMFSVTDSTTAIILSIWLGITLLTDNFLKPILLGLNAPAPMLVIFLGSIGGFIFHGFLGLFLGAVIISLVYKLFMAWLNTEN